MSESANKWTAAGGVSGADAVDREWLIERGLEIFALAMKPKPEKRWDAAKKEYVESGEATRDLQGALRALKFLTEITGAGGTAPGEGVTLIDDIEGGEI